MPSYHDTRAEVIALADHPTHKSFGVFAPVWRMPDGTFAVTQLRRVLDASPPPLRPLSSHDVDQGCAVGGLRRLEHPIPNTPTSHVAFWQGAQPHATLQHPDLRPLAWHTPSSANRYTAQGSPILRSDTDRNDVGFFALERESVLRKRCASWMRGSLAWLAKRTQTPTPDADLGIARIMRRLDPFHPCTQAALWHTYRDTPRQNRHLDWIMRTRRDAGQPSTRDALVAEFRDIIQGAKPPPTRPPRQRLYIPNLPQRAPLAAAR